MRKIGLLGGTFDPPTRGHLNTARRGLDALDLDECWLLPARPWQKHPYAPPHHRLEMCYLATASSPRLRTAGLELNRSCPSYTVETLHALRDLHPDFQFSFLVGDDIDLSTWVAHRELRDLATFVRFSRNGFPALHTDLPRVYSPTPTCSSTTVRQLIQLSSPVDHLLPPAVCRYITTHQLYTQTPRGDHIEVTHPTSPA